jgi:hypothetical protein
MTYKDTTTTFYMDNENLNQFRKILIENNESVSDLEYTKNNYDNDGNLIKEELPTITTNFCEIGLREGEIYLVFILESKAFNLELFSKIKNKSNVKMYGFIEFNKTLYPVSDFNYDKFIDSIQKDKYLQIQFDFKNISTFDLFTDYTKIINVFDKSKVAVVNQLKVNLTNK